MSLLFLKQNSFKGISSVSLPLAGQHLFQPPFVSSIGNSTAPAAFTGLHGIFFSRLTQDLCRKWLLFACGFALRGTHIRARDKGVVCIKGHRSHRCPIIKKKIYVNVKELAKKHGVNKMS